MHKTRLSPTARCALTWFKTNQEFDNTGCQHIGIHIGSDFVCPITHSSLKEQEYIYELLKQYLPEEHPAIPLHKQPAPNGIPIITEESKTETTITCENAPTAFSILLFIFSVFWNSVITVLFSLLADYPRDFPSTTFNISSMYYIFIFIEIMTVIAMAHYMKGKLKILITDNSLTVTRKTAGLFNVTKKIPFNEIIAFMQERDGEIGDDSFPSWGLKIKTKINISRY